MKVKFIVFALLTISVFSSFAQTNNTTLWYRQPATTWTEALPIGNGRM
ncbi:MAG: glycoside hydrolase N-terminal domain-containing protein, partial [Chitinophagaceae bacterium]